MRETFVISGSMVDELTPESVNRLKKGIEYKADKNGIINVAIGRV